MPRYRRPQRRAPNWRAAAIQIAVLTLMLVALLSFKDVIGTGTTAFVESLTAEDVQVAAPDARGADAPGVDAPSRADQAQIDGGTAESADSAELANTPDSPGSSDVD
ncbi:hypothetical protein EA187_05050 [Lujinxingia sediminis]|uniref:Energy transducer TonB n=1 Tax=Lujinxingia sediminis TaxID=2480984 RepID=A0ABY0CZE6_9DELT|nr:hypothetical protein [Lujinxingia sediminis]RVU48800.1 hypothetical protein EA187_05050 [Lujinxingia sediminis]